MTVRWSAGAQQDRKKLFTDLIVTHPAAAKRYDASIADMARRLDGFVLYKRGPVRDTYMCTCNGGRHVIVYSRDGTHVMIEAVSLSRSDWVLACQG